MGPSPTLTGIQEAKENYQSEEPVQETLPYLSCYLPVVFGCSHFLIRGLLERSMAPTWTTSSFLKSRIVPADHLTKAYRSGSAVEAKPMHEAVGFPKDPLPFMIYTAARHNRVDRCTQLALLSSILQPHRHS